MGQFDFTTGVSPYFNVDAEVAQAFKAVYDITTDDLAAYVHGVKVELTRAADIQPTSGCWFGGQFVLNIGTGYADLDKPAYAVQGIIKGDAASPDGVDIHAGRFETQSAGKVSDIVHILANTGTTVVGSLEYIAAHVAPGVAMLNINAQSSITVPIGVKIMSGAASSYNYGLDLSGATINTADIKLHHGHTIIDSASTLTLDTALAMGSNKITGVTDPASAQDAATKNYVDGQVGGLYGINVETLADAKTLTPDTDEIYQYLDEGGDDRIITLATAGATAGDRFVIRHNGVYNDTHYLEAKQAAVSLDKIYAGGIKEFIFDGTNWISRGIGSGEDDVKKYNVGIGVQADGNAQGTAVGYIALGYDKGVAIGYQAMGYNDAVAVGYQAEGYDYGVAVGYAAEGYTTGVAIGRSAQAHTVGIAIGYYANQNSMRNSIALGHQSKCERVGETSVNINGNDTDQENNVVQGRWERATTNDTPVEIFCAGQANAQFTVRASSVLAFRMIITARDNVAGEVAMYTVNDGLIKRDAAGNTTMVNCTVTVVHEDDATWDAAVTADDTNEALIITVTGDADNAVQWAAVMDGVETHF